MMSGVWTKWDDQCARKVMKRVHKRRLWMVYVGVVIEFPCCNKVCML